MAEVVRGEQGSQLAGVAVDDLRVGGVGLVGEVEVGAGDVDPVRFVLDAQGAPAGVDGFDEGGADAAHRIQDEVAGCGVVGDGVAGEVGQHLGRVRGGLGRVAAAALRGR